MKSPKTAPDGVTQRTRRLTLTALLCALALTLSGLEMLIPPLPFLPPGAKLGLSNIVTMFAAGALGLWPALLIAVFKALFSFLMRGGVAFLMSLAGGLFSTLVMGLLLRFVPSLGLIGVGIAGALCHNIAQLLVAVLLTTTAVVYYLPFLLLFALVTGAFTGLVLRLLLPAVTKIYKDL